MIKRNAKSKRSQCMRCSENNIGINTKLAKFIFDIKAMIEFLSLIMAQGQAEMPSEGQCFGYCGNNLVY